MCIYIYIHYVCVCASLYICINIYVFISIFIHIYTHIIICVHVLYEDQKRAVFNMTGRLWTGLRGLLEILLRSAGSLAAWCDKKYRYWPTACCFLKAVRAYEALNLRRRHFHHHHHHHHHHQPSWGCCLDMTSLENEREREIHWSSSIWKSTTPTHHFETCHDNVMEENGNSLI